MRIVRARDGSEMAQRAITVPYIPDDTPSSHADETGYQWPSSDATTFATAEDWESGLYYGEVIENGAAIQVSRAFFIVRAAPGKANSILIHWPFANAHAYSGRNWGNRRCLYDSDEQLRARRVSTQKPLLATSGLVNGGSSEITDGLGFGIGFSSPAWAIFNWLTANGYGVDACSSYDLHADPAALAGYKVLILAGHDEYWSREMRDHVEAFVAAGGNVAVFAGNVAWWQIRYNAAGSQVVCYKNAIEDPLLGVDNSRITANWASAPTARSECRLTGLRTPPGSDDTFGFTIVRDHPVFHDDANGGSPFLSVGETFELGGEADGLDLDTSVSPPVPTLRDGAPDTFQVLAYATYNPWSTRFPAIGYFTNNGTVFACSATGWIASLADPTIAKLTGNIMDWLLQQEGGGSPSGENREIAPPESWTLVEEASFRALTASAQGHVVAATDTGSFVSRHPDMATGWAPFPLDPLTAAPMLALGTDLYGRKLWASTGRTLWVADSSGNHWAPYGADPLVAANEKIVGVAMTDAKNAQLFFLVMIDGIRAELRAMWGSAVHTIGETTGILTIAGCDGYLIGSTTDGRLVARMAGILDDSHTPMAVDLTWMDIGTAPPDTYGLGQSFGRLYALSGTPAASKLSWRSILPDVERQPAVDHGRLLFLNQSSGACAVGRFLGNGDYEEISEFQAGSGWTHLTRINDGMVLFFNAATGEALVGRVAADGSWQEAGRPSGFSSWSIVVSDGEHVLFYRQGAPEGYVGFFDPGSGAWKQTQHRTDYQTKWIRAGSTWGIAVPETEFLRGPNGPGAIIRRQGAYVVFYAADGTLAIGLINAFGSFQTLTSAAAMANADTLVPAGQLGILLYDSRSGAAEYGELSFDAAPTYVSRYRWPAGTPGSFSPGWLPGAARNGLVFLYDPRTATAHAGGFSRATGYQELNHWSPAAGFSTGWTHIVGI